MTTERDLALIRAALDAAKHYAYDPRDRILRKAVTALFPKTILAAFNATEAGRGQVALDPYWTVAIEVYAFETENAACDLRDKLEDAFIAIPEMADYGFLSRIEKETP